MENETYTYQTLDDVIEDSLGKIISAEAANYDLGMAFDNGDSRDFLRWWLDQDKMYRDGLERFVGRQPIKNARGFPFNIAIYALTTYHILTGKIEIGSGKGKRIRITSQEGLEYLKMHYFDKKVDKIRDGLTQLNSNSQYRINLRIRFEDVVNKIAQYKRCVEHFNGQIVSYSIPVAGKEQLYRLRKPDFNGLFKGYRRIISESVSSALKKRYSNGYAVVLGQQLDSSMVFRVTGLRSLDNVKDDLQQRLDVARDAVPGYIKEYIIFKLSADPMYSERRQLILTLSGKGEEAQQLTMHFLSEFFRNSNSVYRANN